MPRAVPLTPKSAALVAALATFALAGCGSDDRPQAKTAPVTVVLDWSANPAHSGLLTTIERGIDRKRGVRLSLRTPPSSSDGIRLLLSGRANLAVLDLHDLAIARERGRDVVAVMSVVGRPLASLIAAPSIHRPRDLEGKRVATSGAPSDTAVTRAIVSADGGDPRRVRITPAGYASIEALLGGRAAAATGFLNEEGVSVTDRRRGFRVFPLEASGAPAYPELVLVATPATLRDRPELVEAAVGAIAEGTRIAVAEPEATLGVLRGKLPGVDPGLLERRMTAALSVLLPPNGVAGSIDRGVMLEWSRWEAEQGVVRKPPDVDRLMTTRFLGGQSPSSN